MTGHRERIIAAALEVTGTEGWGAVTMARLARMAGVSRQTVYNEIGAKPELARTLVAHELHEFLNVVEDAFARHPADPVTGVRDAVLRSLTLAEKNPLVRAVVAGSGGAADDLAPLLTTRSELVLDAAKSAVRRGMPIGDSVLPERDIDNLVDAVVRVTISHMMQPTGTPESTADALASITAAVLQRGGDPAT